MEPRPKLGELLVRAGVIDRAQLASALGEQRHWGRPLGMTLVRMGFVEEDALIEALASQLKLPIVKLRGKLVNPDVLGLVPSELAEKHRCIPLLVNEEGGRRVLYLGMEDPADLEALDDIRFRLGEKVKPVLVAPSELDEALHRHYHWAAGPGSDSRLDEVAGSPSGEDLSGADLVADGALAAPSDRADGPARGVRPEAIQRALIQLLVEKGVIGRDELVARIRDVVREEDGDL